MIIFYDLRCTEQSQIRFGDAQFWKSLARLSRQLAVSGIIRRLALTLVGFDAVAMMALLK